MPALQPPDRGRLTHHILLPTTHTPAEGTTVPPLILLGAAGPTNLEER